MPKPPGETAPHLDVLSEVLRTVRLTGATFFSAEFRAPWGFTSPPIDTVAKTLQDPDAHLVLFHLVLKGRATARVEGAAEITLEAGDIVAFPQGHAHRVWQGRPLHWYDTAPAVRRALAGGLQVTRTGGVGDATRFVCGYFSCDRWASEVILSGLPSMLTVSVRDGERRGWLEDAIQFLAAEAASDHAGRSALLTKLSEALFVETLRRWMTALPAEHLGWLAGARDDVVGRALALLHRQPSRRWTLDALARDVGASRSTLAERFAHYLHEPPMTYLARWRLQLGAPARHHPAQCARNRGARGLRVGGRVQPGFQAQVRTATGSLSPRSGQTRRRNTRTCRSPPTCTASPYSGSLDGVK